MLLVGKERQPFHPLTGVDSAMTRLEGLFWLAKKAGLSTPKTGWRMAPPLKECVGYRVNFLVDDTGFDGFLTQAAGDGDAMVTILHVVI